MSNDIITITDLRKVGHCARGIKTWFDEKGLNFRQFLAEGISVEKFAATGDGNALRALKKLGKIAGGEK